jgi:Fe-S cluster assembly protein SufD
MAFTKSNVEELSAALGEPGWVLDRRLEAWRSFEALDIPNEKEEPWRYTDLRRLRFDLDQFTPALPKAITRVSNEAEELVRQEGDRAGYLIQRDADVAHVELDPSLAGKGVILSDLNSAIQEHGDLIKDHLFKDLAHENVFKALHRSLFCGGTFLYVPKGVTVALPIEGQHWIEQSGFATFPHTLIVVEEDAEVVYFERLQSSVDKPSLSDAGLEVAAGRAARISIVSLQELGPEVWHFQSQRTATEADVQLRSLVVTLGARFSRNEVSTVIEGERSAIEMLGLYFAESGQHFDFRTLQDHVAGQSKSDLLYKGALKDESRAVYAGLIRVNKGAAYTDAYQTNRNLVLSDHAKADSKPELEIENNEVKCSHAASVSQIEENELFYLQSRGIPNHEAQRLIVHGFFEDVVSRIRNTEIRTVLLEAIETKLAGSARAQAA